MQEQNNLYKAELVEWLNLLASPARIQIEFLHNAIEGSSGGSPSYLPVDELALEYDNLISIIDNVPQRNHFSAEAREELKSLNDYFESFSGEHYADLWSYHALETSEVWEKVRNKALYCLSVIG